ncbi:hypothetical protein ENUP19_0274G0042 [Entamoeba nuttalli]|uniref:C2 domain containing protein n=2 Tax=Entamoeba nuttalli TaxID=412467 RepID=K2G7D4_ENTNP|nr:C2 domain containing protein [Entamoeba nuttalli P19]EKE38326.1 C2 domain containing protein [Entamoeba nuttalli P19]|eukprot:XP_008859332.1 C2 domain containing protein [Entamoeba nuttalli P19]
MSMFEITFVKGMNWPKADPIGWCDPFCVFTNNGKEYKTKHDNNTSEPKWEETFTVVSDHQPLEILCFDWDRIGDDDFLGKFCINLDDFCDVTTNKNIKFDITLEEEYLTKKKVEEKPAAVVLTITNLERKKKEEEERLRREEEEKRNNESMTANARKEAMGECKDELLEFAEEGLKEKLRPVQLTLMKWTKCNDYHLIYSSDIDELSCERISSLLSSISNCMILILDSTGNLFGIFAPFISESCSTQFTLFSLKGYEGPLSLKFTPLPSSDSLIQISPTKNIILSVKNAFTIALNDQSFIDASFSNNFTSSHPFESTILTGKVSPDKFSIRCFFALQWY